MIKNILLAEDDRGTALLVRNFLQSKGYVVYPAGNGLEALKILSSYIVDLIITDVVMPEMDGVDLYEAVKKNPKTVDIPIIIVTDKQMFKESFTTLGVSNFVEKASDINALLERIKTIQQTGTSLTKFPKILISANHLTVVEQVTHALKDLQYLVLTATSSDALIASAITTMPSNTRPLSPAVVASRI